MFKSLLKLLFRCPHKRMTRPMTPGRRAGAPLGDTYVVCLDCGKQFLYDMKDINGKSVPVSPVVSVLHERMPRSKVKTLRYVALASAVPLALIVRAGFKRLRKSSEPRRSHKSNGASKLDDTERSEV